MSNTKKQLLNHLRETIKTGNDILSQKEWNEPQLDKYHAYLEELVAASREAKGINFMIARKLNAIELFNEAKDYDNQLNIILKKIVPPAKKASKKQNLDNYIKKQNLVLAAIEYYYRHEI